MAKTSAYEEKVAELLEARDRLAREGQKEQEKLDGILVNKRQASERLAALRALENAKVELLAQLDVEIALKSAESRSKVARITLQKSSLEQEIKEISSVSKTVLERLTRLATEEKKAEKVIARKDKAEKVLAAALAALQSAKAEQRAVLAACREEKALAEKEWGELEKGKALLAKNRGALRNRVKSIVFYARRLAKIYKLKGWDLPASYEGTVKTLINTAL